MKLRVFKNIILFSCVSIFIHANPSGFLSNYNDTIELQQINLKDKKQKVFHFDYLKGVFNNQIYTGKKNQLILVKDQSSSALNNARQMYSQTVSLNIFQTDDAGLQLNIGGRGLDPKRTANFNVRQNYYDISADPLGYPESYYVPPFEALSSIELIRGAASLQYGTQFGGFLNFNIKKPNPNRKMELITRNTIASNNLYTNFSSISGTINNYSYYIFYNFKKGDGFRPNSQFQSDNFYSYLGWELNNKINFSFELTYLNYLAQQPGGLTDAMFNLDMFQSNRERNWFKINWLLYNFKTNFSLSSSTEMIFSAFALNASRNSVGFRTNRVSQIDSYQERDLIKADFDNIGFETKITHSYSIFNRRSTLLLGQKFFKGNTLNIQGPGSSGSNADFDFAYNLYPNYENQSYYENPNINAALFLENIIYLNSKISIVPGLRYEYIQTESDGYYREINTDNADNVILNQINSSYDNRERSFLLFGLGYSYNLSNQLEMYANCSQNYRAVTFADINIVNPSFVIDPAISDEDGYNLDLGFRGTLNKKIRYDLSLFYMFYNNRIGFIQRTFDDMSVKNQKGNVGDAKINGFESLLNFNLTEILNLNSNYNFSWFINNSILSAEYVSSQVNGVEGNQVEFVPKYNFKSGLKFNYQNFNFHFQYSYLSSQFTDATNSVESDMSGLIGLIPSYSILDLSMSYILKNIKLELGCNNILDKHYFTTRATGYPGPGIIPAINRNFYVTLEYKF